LRFREAIKEAHKYDANRIRNSRDDIFLEEFSPQRKRSNIEFKSGVACWNPETVSNGIREYTGRRRHAREEFQRGGNFGSVLGTLDRGPDRVEVRLPRYCIEECGELFIHALFISVDGI
jgi:hypothetical protein